MAVNIAISDAYLHDSKRHLSANFHDIVVLGCTRDL